MSFGFGVGDFIAVADLAWKLYRYCYVVAKDAPRDFKLLLQEICTLASSIKLLKDEVDDPESTLRRSGEDRIRMINDIISRIKITLEELEKYAKRYEGLQGVPRSKRKKLWDRFTWSLEGSEIDSLRVKISRHNGDLSLILIGAGNSSLQRLESAVLTLQKDFSEIKGYIDLFQNPKPELGGALVIDNEVFKISSMGAALMKNAETGQRRWSAIGIDEWIQAGRWWLLKSQMNLYVKSSSGQIISQQGYADLIKAAWILVDIIGRHPQLDFLDSGIRYEVVQLTQTIRAELGNIKTLGLLKPSFEDLDNYDLNIWETQVKGPTLQPGKGVLKSGPSYQSWATAEDDVLFQRFGHYQSSPFATKTQCIVLFLMHKREREAKIVVRDQSWNTLATFIVGKTSLVHPTETFVNIERQRIGLLTPQDAQHLCAISEGVEEYLFHCDRAENDHEIIEAFTFLFAVKNNYRDFLGVLERGPNPNSQANPPKASLASRIQIAAGDLLRNRVVHDNNDELDSNTSYISVFRWAAREGYHTVALLFLEAKGTVVSEKDVQEWYSLYYAACDGKVDIVTLLLSENGVDAETLGVEGHAALIGAAQGGYGAVVDKLLGAGVDINSLYRTRTALQVAAEGGHEMLVDKLLKAGANVNAEAVSHHGLTALQAAAGGGHIALVDRLLKAGAEVNAQPATNGQTALQAAAGGGHKIVVEMLLNAKADVSAQAPRYGGRTAVQAAAGGGYEALVDRLLKVGADVNAPAVEFNGRTALQAAAEGGHEAVVKRLLKAGADVNTLPKYQDGRTALQAAAGGGYETVVDILLEAGACVNTQPAGCYGRTALQAAAGGGYEAVVYKLLGFGANIDAEPASVNGRTALQAAAGGGHEKMVEILLKAGAGVNAERSQFEGRTALQAAAEGGHEVVVDKLLKAGADTNVGGTSELQLAAVGGHGAVVDMLLEAGADVNTPTVGREERTALQAAAVRGDEKMVDRLLKAGADSNTANGRAALQVAARGGHETVVDMLLEAGADINAPAISFIGRTALQAAAEVGHESLVFKLLKAGADVNAQPGIEAGRTALQAAAGGGNEAVVNMLLEAGADVNAPPATRHGRTALQAAAGEGHIALVDKLLKCGANIHAPRASYDGRTVVEAAAEGGHQAMVDKLLKAGAKGLGRQTQE